MSSTATVPPVVRVSGLRKRFVIRKEKSLKERIVNFGRSRVHKEDFYALDGIDLEIAEGTTIGLIGPNGSGKSTLLKAIGGIIQPTQGTVLRRGRLAALLELGAGFHPDLTGRENVYLNAAILGLTAAETSERFDDIVEFSGIAPFIDTQVKFYSSGMYMRLAFAVAVHVDPDLLLVDEVLAVGDEPFQQKCFDRIRQFQAEGKTIVLVTHSLDTVAEFCNRAIVMRAGQIAYDGEPREAIQVLRDDFEESRRREADARGIEVGTFGARVEEIRIMADASDQPVTHVQSGTDVTIAVTISCETPVPEWDLGVTIDTPHGHVVYSTSIQRQDVLPAPLTGRTTIEYSIPRLNLGAGQYLIQSFLWADDRGEIARHFSPVSLTVVSDRNDGGSTEFEATVSLEPRLISDAGSDERSHAKAAAARAAAALASAH